MAKITKQELQEEMHKVYEGTRDFAGFDFGLNYMGLDTAMRNYIDRFIRNCSKKELIELFEKAKLKGYNPLKVTD